jgi:hypothetical protein
MLHDRKVTSKNISSQGVYFEVIANDITNYTPGKAFMIEVDAIASCCPQLPDRKIRLTGTGVIVRADVLDTATPDRRLGVALKFHEKLEVCHSVSFDNLD